LTNTPATVSIKKSSQASAKSSSTPSSRIARAYERFWEMPVAFLLVVLWLAGVALMGLCALVLYFSVGVLGA
jgi:beta-lactamase regulating signal transducer with metallopeptidase domain